MYNGGVALLLALRRQRIAEVHLALAPAGHLMVGKKVRPVFPLAIGSFYDDALNSYLGFDGENDFVVYGASVGKA